MKKQIITGVSIIACVALCANLWLRSAEVGNLPAEPVKTAVSTETEARSEETPQILFSADAPVPVTEAVAEIEPPKTEVTAEKETKTAPPPDAKPNSVEKSSPTSSEPKPGNKKVIDSGTTVGNPGDELIGHKVGIMGGGTTVDGKGDIHKMVGVMGADDSAPSSTSPPAYAEPEITGDVIYTELQPPVTKNSTPPAYKPNGEPYTPWRIQRKHTQPARPSMLSSFCSFSQSYEAFRYIPECSASRNIVRCGRYYIHILS